MGVGRRGPRSLESSPDEPPPPPTSTPSARSTSPGWRDGARRALVDRRRGASRAASSSARSTRSAAAASAAGLGADRARPAVHADRQRRCCAYHLEPARDQRDRHLGDRARGAPRRRRACRSRELRGNVSTETISTGARLGREPRLRRWSAITVSGQKPKRVERRRERARRDRAATTPPAALRPGSRSQRSRTSIASINQRLTSVAGADRRATPRRSRNAGPRAARQARARRTSSTPRIARQGNLNDRSVAAEQRSPSPQDVERAQIITQAAVAEKTTARSRRNSILVGALIGLIVGVIAALVVDWRASRAQPA